MRGDPYGKRPARTGLLALTSVAGSVRVLHELAQVGLVCVTCFDRRLLLRLTSVGLSWASVVIVDSELVSPLLIPSLRLRASCPLLLLCGPDGHPDADEYGADAVLTGERPLGPQVRPWLGWPAVGSEVMECAGLWLDRTTQLAYWRGTPLRLTGQQFRLLWRLADAAGGVVPLAELSDAVYEGHVGNDRQRVMAHVRRIRQFIEPDPRHPRTLQTVRGVGFRLVPRVLGPSRALGSSA